MDSIVDVVDAIEVISTTTTEPTMSYDLSLDQVNWKSHYKLHKASLGQIIASFRNILKAEPKNKYEITLYYRLKPAVEILIDIYNEILKCDSLKEHDVKYFNLIYDMPKLVEVYPGEHGDIRLRKPKIGALIKASKQRIKFIMEREIPGKYFGDDESIQEFNNLKSQMKDFESIILDFEAEFILAINEAHQT